MNRKVIIRVGVFIFLYILMPGVLLAQSYVYDTIINRVKQDLLSRTDRQLNAAQKLLSSIQPNGSWSDVDYDDRAMVKWGPNGHLLNLRVLIERYITGGDSSKEEMLYGAIEKAFNYWYEKDPVSKNWWHNEIATPQSLGELMILMKYGKQQLPGHLEDSLLKRMKRGDPYKQTGANKTDIALHYFYRALLTKDSVLLKEAVAQLFAPIRLVHFKEGLQYDNSYLQHGPQLQISSYGFVFLTGAVTVASYVRGTSYALDQQKTELLSNFYRNAYLKTIRGSYIDFNVEGRGISRKDILSKHTEKKRLELMALIDKENFTEWRSAMMRTEGIKPPGYKVTPYHTHFWCGDYTMHLRPAYSFNIRIASNRTRRCEMGNDENLLGRYLSDGATNLQRKGPEYFNIMPVWEWDKIPGVTSRDYLTDRPMSTLWGETGSTVFAGGVSDGVYGVTAYDLNYDSVTAKKAWFLFDEQIVCLGAGIHSAAAEEVTTTVNQCWTNGRILVAGEKKRIDKKEVFAVKDKRKFWVLHDSVGYYFPIESNLTISNINQVGSWNRINKSFSDEKVEGDVFKLCINHGNNPVNAEYAYIILPFVQSAKQMKDFDESLIRILMNSDHVQAVYHAGLKILQAVFYRPGKIRLAQYSITVDQPCVLMISNMDAKSKNIFIADPTQKTQDLTIQISNLSTHEQKSRKVSLPVKEMAGSTLRINIELN